MLNKYHNMSPTKTNNRDIKEILFPKDDKNRRYGFNKEHRSLLFVFFFSIKLFFFNMIKITLV